MSELEDIKLQALLQGMKLESPNPNFSVGVMNKIFEENNALEKIKSEKVLGKGFWIISSLFVTLLILIFIFSNSGMSTDSQLLNLLPDSSSRASEGFHSILSRLGGIPLMVGAIFAAFSTLLFLDRFISSNSKVFV